MHSTIDERGRRVLPDNLGDLDDDELTAELGETCGDVQFSLGHVVSAVGAFVSSFGGIVPALLAPDQCDDEASRGIAMGSVLAEWQDATQGDAERLYESMRLLDRLIAERNRRLGLKHREPSTPEEIVASLFGMPSPKS
ncbi:hypothetical protein Tamer19_16500 [Cupriavidus sp. TA19]|uniref:hypothetical protein n=1 Tax=unclassified Cupriavidus TaxID=2640874 RepID=UPI00272940F6|nr:hypothetical protein [Cupriavidus sp. TA19]GLC92242.1 hypothetical protein Tamer19_16500 [Cupriavidus sp. TA19]